ncbi:DUF2637 domain-containing protein [Streptomyces sp. NBC_01373]|uniref:DUF2637 domain-containing protein n=1 Tax=Streptomyces sp. NBC_01373 TaxID=2903843 RepID=UPI00225263FF|nr:DUF2637 domain-containing protein [Streptomyces sp. NBC_01373]MCX4700093.1 DUF2637 domain-containing protein [Streptomyces sp. NBC_01373]
MTRSIRFDAVLVQAVIAGALSFAHLHDLAEAAGQTGWKAWAYPISVDLLLVAAWRRLRAQHSRLAWCWFLIALVASLGANVATAGFLDLAHPPAWLRFGVAGWPALAFLGGTLLAHAPDRPVDTADDAATPPAPEALDVEREPAAPAPAVETPAALPAADPTPTPAVSVPAALVDHARKIAADHHARTGTPIDTATLRTRLGVPAPMADAIAAQLT